MAFTAQLYNVNCGRYVYEDDVIYETSVVLTITGPALHWSINKPNGVCM